MIGSIGAESRYSTGYNNLKPNRNQNKWADTLAQTVDKDCLLYTSSFGGTGCD